MGTWMPAGAGMTFDWRRTYETDIEMSVAYIYCQFPRRSQEGTGVELRHGHLATRRGRRLRVPGVSGTIWSDNQQATSIVAQQRGVVHGPTPAACPGRA
jgi:hypothetical protein